MVCGTADILMKFLSLGWFGLGYSLKRESE